ncbi:MAG: mechanosensitive ion channel family protein [Actinobacteria bacterium]|nr:mechanosensitive ion channel family protein [Actinomycetota bacterium]
MIPAALLGATVVTTTTSDGLTVACGPKGQQGWLCTNTYRLTHNRGAAEVADALSKPVRILVILAVAWLLVRLVRRLIRRAFRRVGEADDRISALRRRSGLSWLDTGPVPNARRVQRADTVGALVSSIVGVAIWAMAVVSVLDVLGVALGPIIAGAGIVGVAIGFGSQSLVKDFLTGIFMLIEDQYGVGDVIDAGVASGTVEGVSLRTTRLRDVEGVVWHVPNGTIARVGNKSQQWSRALVDVIVPPGADLRRAIEVIKETAADLWHDPDFGRLMMEAPEVWGVEDVAVDQVKIRVVAKTQPLEQWRVGRELRIRIALALQSAGITASTTTTDPKQAPAANTTESSATPTDQPPTASPPPGGTGTSEGRR